MIIQDPVGSPAGQNGGGCLHLKTVTEMTQKIQASEDVCFPQAIYQGWGQGK